MEAQTVIEYKYSVSLVYTKQFSSTTSHALRSIILSANNEDEALGAAIRKIESDSSVKGWQLYLKCIIKIDTDYNPTKNKTP